MSETRERFALEVLRRFNQLVDEQHLVVMGPQYLTDPLWDDIEALLEPTPASDGGEVRERALDIVDFLHGAGPLDGRWFHERPAGAGPYWWRRHLEEIRAALLRTPRGEGEPVAYMVTASRDSGGGVEWVRDWLFRGPAECEEHVRWLHRPQSRWQDVRVTPLYAARLGEGGGE